MTILKTKVSIEDKVVSIARDKDHLLKDAILSNYIPFIIKVASETLNRYIEVENDEYFSIALEAFNEAIDNYQLGKGKFLSFASCVIKRRIIDARRRTRQDEHRVISMETYIHNHQGTLPQEFIDRTSLAHNTELRDEIMDYVQALKGYSITLDDLIQHSPKHGDTRMNCLLIAKTLAQDDDCRVYFKIKKAINRKKISTLLPVTTKVLKRNRKFIIACALIYIDDYQALKSYLNRIGGDSV